MLQQTQADRVVPKYREFLSLFPNFQALASASPADVIRAWSPLGYNRRAINLHRLASVIVERHDGKLPTCEKCLRSLPGVGEYTAAAIACFAFDGQNAVIDTNVRRVLLRFGGVSSCSLADLRGLAAAYLPAAHAKEWNQALMDLGAGICRATAPNCGHCPMRLSCRSAGSIVSERRARYRTGVARYEGSDRQLRGRIIELLRTSQELERKTLGEVIGLADVAAAGRLEGLIAGLERDGLVQTNGEFVSLPGH
jgi:A/G-specific adenine glycosylase